MKCSSNLNEKKTKTITINEQRIKTWIIVTSHLSEEVQVIVRTMKNSRYAINGKLWKVKKGCK
jgi:ribosomal protein S16